MKQQFEFSKLKKETISSKVHPDRLFFAMLDLCDDRYLRSVMRYPDEFFWAIPDGIYCIAQQKLAVKGGRRTFAGEMVYATKENLADFVKKALEDEELSDLLVALRFDTVPPFVGYISSGGYCHLYVNVDQPH